ncbi:COMM domain-containing protein 3-like [Asterias rubens]|uniref:COMM domain-containing protein 3-like n=1 Tax=Asterias rubens TaxID=7604 RepID=UPI0014552C80|nr:COMM domain-containing protein 3-like [Asterias rubens]
MEVSAEVQEGLQLAGDSGHLPNEAYTYLVEKVFEDVFKRAKARSFQDDEILQSLDAAVLKQAYGALSTLALEGAKHDANSSSISTLLEDCKWNTDRTNGFINVFLDQKEEVRVLLGNIRQSHPHIVDVDWRLDYYMKSNHVDKINEASYLITLKTEEGLQNATKDVQFSCSLEQLQDLVGKLKDASRSLEKASLS